jgi:hypothetical protein
VYTARGRLRADDLLVRERVGRGLGDASARLRELAARWRVRNVGLDELLQFDWTLVGEADALAQALANAPELDATDALALDARLRTIREVLGDRRRYIEVLA